MQLMQNVNSSGSFIHMGDSDVISSCHIYASFFYCRDVGQLCKVFAIVTSLSL